MAEQIGVTFEQVSKAATDMITHGATPSVRGVMKITGGKTETVSRLLRDFNDKRNADVLKIADEVGSGAIAKLIANEMQNVVDRKTANLKEILVQQKTQLNEAIELLEEKENDCKHRVELAEAQVTKATNEANDKVAKFALLVEQAEQEAKQANTDAESANVEAKSKIEAAENKCNLLIENAKNEASALVEAANVRADKAEQEAFTLRTQVQSLTVDKAKREIEQVQHETTQKQHQNAVKELAEARTAIVQLQTQHENKVADVERLQGELAEAKADSRSLSEAQGQLVELQRQVSHLQNDLSLSERERESLSLALRKDND